MPGFPGFPLKGLHSGKKKNTKINSLGPETARWGGGLLREGVVAEKFVPSLKSLSSVGFQERNLGCPGNFAGMVFKKFVQKKFVRIFRSPSIRSLKHAHKWPQELQKMSENCLKVLESGTSMYKSAKYTLTPHYCHEK